MSGKPIAILILACALFAGAALYYLQVYGYYREVPASGPTDVMLVPLTNGAPEPVPHAGFRAIDAESSPIRFRACFTSGADPNALAAKYQVRSDAVPRNAPSWFECFDAAAIAALIEQGKAQVFLGEKNVHYGVDRIVAITDDGYGYAWNELNDCGTKAYDGTVVGETCPPRPAN